VQLFHSTRVRVRVRARLNVRVYGRAFKNSLDKC
jgi:hypothetical protein